MREVVVWSPMTQAEADIVAAGLGSIGIEARVKGEIIRAYGPIGQMQVIVDEADADEATSYLAAHPNELEADELDGVVGISRGRSRRAGLAMLLVVLVVPLLVVLATIITVLAHF
jgi:hypothetical protein